MSKIIPFKVSLIFTTIIKLKNLVEESQKSKVLNEIKDSVIRYHEPYPIDKLNTYSSSATIIEQSFIDKLIFNDAKIISGQVITSDKNIENHSIKCKLISKPYLVRNTEETFYTLEDIETKEVFNFSLEQGYDYQIHSLD